LLAQVPASGSLHTSWPSGVQVTCWYWSFCYYWARPWLHHRSSLRNPDPGDPERSLD
jgi:hypothetical protein